MRGHWTIPPLFVATDRTSHIFRSLPGQKRRDGLAAPQCSSRCLLLLGGFADPTFMNNRLEKATDVCGESAIERLADFLNATIVIVQYHREDACLRIQCFRGGCWNRR